MAGEKFDPIEKHSAQAGDNHASEDLSRRVHQEIGQKGDSAAAKATDLKDGPEQKAMQASADESIKSGKFADKVQNFMKSVPDAADREYYANSLKDGMNFNRTEESQKIMLKN